jgi:alpha-beta hydrolase superfamily lysophospholipase
MDVFLQESKERYGDDLPTFLYGHSLGAALVLHYGFNRTLEIQSAVITSPPLATTTKTSAFKKALARILARIAPSLTMNNDLPVDGLSRDKAICRAYQDDPYVHNKVSARLGLDILDVGERTLAKADAWDG